MSTSFTYEHTTVIYSLILITHICGSRGHINIEHAHRGYKSPQAGFDPPKWREFCYQTNVLLPSHHGWIVIYFMNSPFVLYLHLGLLSSFQMFVMQSLSDFSPPEYHSIFFTCLIIKRQFLNGDLNYVQNPDHKQTGPKKCPKCPTLDLGFGHNLKLYHSR